MEGVLIEILGAFSAMGLNLYETFNLRRSQERLALIPSPENDFMLFITVSYTCYAHDTTPHSDKISDTSSIYTPKDITLFDFDSYEIFCVTSTFSAINHFLATFQKPTHHGV